MFDKEGHDFSEADLFFFLAVGETGDFLALDRSLRFEARTCRNAPVEWHTMPIGLPAAMQDSISLIECSSSARSHIGLWPRIEDRVEVSLPHAVKANGLAKLRFHGRILLEAEGEVGAKYTLIALGVQGKSSALGPLGDASVISAPASLKP